MNDLEQELRELFERRASDVRTPAEAPAAVLKRGRRRQVGTVALSAFTVLVVVVGSIAGLHGVLRGTPSTHVGGEPFTRTATIRGFTVSSPSDWTLVDEWPLAAGIATSGGTSFSKTCTATSAGTQSCSPVVYSPIPVPTGLPVFRLSNFDAGLSDAACDARIPNDGASLYVAFRPPIDTANQPTAAWPRPLTDLLGAAPGSCGAGKYSFFSVGNATYMAYAAFGAGVSAAARQQVFDTFAALNPEPVKLAPSPDHTPGYVIAGGDLPGGPWRIEARPYAHGVNLELIAGERTLSPGGTDFVLTSGLLFLAENSEPRFGVVTNQAAGVEFRPADGSSPIEGTIVSLPSGLVTHFNAFFIEGVGNVSGDVFAIGQNGQPLNDKAEAIGGSSTAAGSATVAPSHTASSLTGSVVATGHDLGADWTLRAGYDGTAVCTALEVSGSDTSPPSCGLPGAVTAEALVPILHRIANGALLAGTVPTSTGAVSVKATVKTTGDVVIRRLVPWNKGSGVDFFVVPVAAPGPVVLDFLDANGNVVASVGFDWASATAAAPSSPT